jgi:hypothetical protein
MDQQDIIIKAGELDIYLQYISTIDVNKPFLTLTELRNELIKIAGAKEYIKTVKIFGTYEYNKIALKQDKNLEN